MISQIVVKNFQSHKHTVLDLHPGINIITGPSDSGKSALRRALVWNKDNKPDGLDDVSDWNRKGKAGTPIDPTVSKVIFSDGQFVERSRDSENNGYVISYGPPLGAIGRGPVPPEVTAAWNVNEANFSDQHDPPFLLSIPAGQVAEYLNRSVHLDLIDTALSRAEVDRKDVNREIKVLTEQEKSQKAQVADMEWVPKAVELSARRDILLAQQKVMAAQVATLSSTLDTLYTVSEALREKQDIVAVVWPIIQAIGALDIQMAEKQAAVSRLTVDLNSLADIHEQLDEKVPVVSATEDALAKLGVLLNKEHLLGQGYDSLVALLDRIEAISMELADLRTTAADLRTADKILQDLADLQTKRTLSKEQYQKLWDACESLEGLHTKWIAARDELAGLEEELDAQMDGQCPVCAGPLGGVHAH